MEEGHKPIPAEYPHKSAYAISLVVRLRLHNAPHYFNYYQKLKNGDSGDEQHVGNRSLPLLLNIYRFQVETDKDSKCRFSEFQT